MLQLLHNKKLKKTCEINLRVDYANRVYWEHIPDEIARDIIETAEAYLKKEILVCPATAYLAYTRTGSRAVYQKYWDDTRNRLFYMMMAEGIENQGRFVDGALDAVWAICEETSWCIPSTNNQPYDDGIWRALPDVQSETGQTYVQLWPAETASILSWAYYMLHDRFDAISELINQRIVYEVSRHIIHPFVEKNFKWMGLSGEHVNNWVPWICSNVLTATMILEKEDSVRAAAFRKAIKLLEIFINSYGNDGGCDEGPGYWTAAAASLFDCIELLNAFVQEPENSIYADPLLKAMGEYIAKVYIDQKYFVNRADTKPTCEIDSVLIYRFGDKVSSEMMKDFALYHRNISDQMQRGYRHCFRTLQNYAACQDFLAFAAGDPPVSEHIWLKDVWLENIQLMSARETCSNQGFFINMKGGTNAESHNHNDVGSVILYYNGKPVVVDPGVGEYTKDTFSDKRYELFVMRSNSHSLPAINGYEQCAGANYRAMQVRYSWTDQESRLSCSLKDAYPQDAQIDKYNRTCALNRGEEPTVTVTDTFQLKKDRNEVVLHFTFYTQPVQISSTEFVLCGVSETEKLVLCFENQYDKVTVEKEMLNDRLLKQKWETDRLYVLSFYLSCDAGEYNCSFVIKKISYPSSKV